MAPRAPHSAVDFGRDFVHIWGTPSVPPTRLLSGSRGPGNRHQPSVAGQWMNAEPVRRIIPSFPRLRRRRASLPRKDRDGPRWRSEKCLERI